MSEASLPRPADTDRNLLFGVLALQAALIDNDQFAEVCAAWTTRKDRRLAELLVERGWITGEEEQEVERFLRRHLHRHRGDVRASLAAAAGDAARQSLATLADSEVQESLASLPQPAGPVQVSTITYRPGSRERYSLTRLHATGGIGRVWLARDGDLGREVALKEVRPERAHSPAVWARFLEEAQITGQLEHPGIVPVYELQRSGEQRPFYTMRFVRGQSLSEASAAYHQKRRAGRAGPLDLRELLGAFVGVCNAVAYAHARGVVHRDLKGRNVVLGGFGEVMVLDWGLAKLVDRPAEGADVPPVAVQQEEGREETVHGEVLGTPAFMAPEQAAGRPDLIGPRTDVYGLGAVLYELLTGQAPFSGTDTQEVLRKVREEEPALPRQAFAEVPRALEAVCLHAMAKKPEERYASAREVAQEVQRWLADEPVAVYHEPWPLRAGRWVRRHRSGVAAAVAAAGVAGVCLVAATLLLAAANQREHAAKELALRREREAEDNFQLARQAVDDYSIKVSQDQRLLESFRPLRKQLLQTAVPFYEKLVEQRGDDPAVQAELGRACMRLGSITREIDDQNKAIASYQQARAIFTRLAADDPTQVSHVRDLAECHNGLGLLYHATGKTAEAEAAYREALAVEERLVDLHPDDPQYQSDLAATHNSLAILYRDTSKAAKAEGAFQRALSLRKRIADAHPDNPQYQRDLAATHNNLGTLYRDIGKTVEEEKAYRDALTLRQRLAGRQPEVAQYQRELAGSQRNLAILYSETGRPAESEKAYREALAIDRQLAARYPEVPLYQSQLAKTLDSQGNLFRAMGRTAEGEKAHQEARVLFERLAEQHAEVVEYTADLGGCYCNLGHLAQDKGTLQPALEWYARAIRSGEAVLHKEPGEVSGRGVLSIAHESRGKVLSKLGRHAEALRDCELALEYDNGRDRDAIRVSRAIVLARAGDYARAKAEADDLAGGKSVSGEDLYNLACVYSLAAAAAAKDAKLPATDRGKLTESYAVRAVGLLAQARGVGYFKEPANRDNLKKDEDLEPLRSREDFRRLLADLDRAREAPK